MRQTKSVTQIVGSSLCVHCSHHLLWTTANSVSFSMCQSLWCYNPPVPKASSSSTTSSRLNPLCLRLSFRSLWLNESVVMPASWSLWARLSSKRADLDLQCWSRAALPAMWIHSRWQKPQTLQCIGSKNRYINIKMTQNLTDTVLCSILMHYCVLYYE